MKQTPQGCKVNKGEMWNKMSSRDQQFWPRICLSITRCKFEIPAKQDAQFNPRLSLFYIKIFTYVGKLADNVNKKLLA